MALILVAEPAAPVAATLRRFLEMAGHEVLVANRLAEAEARVQEQAPQAVLASCSPGLDGEDLCRRVKEVAPGTPVLLLYPPEEEMAETRATSVGADACLVGPLKRPNVLSTLALMLKLASARAEPDIPVVEDVLEEEPTTDPGAPATAAPQPEPRLAAARPAPEASPDLEFLKRLLFMELKRSRRYRYPISLLLLEPDRFAERTASRTQAERTSALAEMLGRLTQSLREIDVAVPFAQGRFIVFLPHTPYLGARIVAERLLQRVKEVESVPELTASIGLAVFEPLTGSTKNQVSFGSMLKEASEALKRAQAAGGDRLEMGERGRPDPFSLE
jgi:diguanylate cyclase (GGDEF)-like protein